MIPDYTVDKPLDRMPGFSAFSGDADGTDEGRWLYPVLGRRFFALTDKWRETSGECIISWGRENRKIC